MAGGPDRPGGLPEVIFQHGVPKMGSNMGSKMGTKMGPKMGSKMGSKQGSKNGVPNGVPGFGGLPKMVAPRQFCFDTLDGLGPRSVRGPSGGHFFSVFKNGDQNWIPKMGSKNEIQNGIQKWGPTAAITTSSYHHE